ncbi:MAG: hypothetical protein ACYCQH_09460 [Acidithiobacillus ferrooxidans]|uniref:Uncharacterized protein n=1 Tax=mine drainage metagenome TaxID=410659 RepID=E6QEU2_9ZZZZ|nr:hypothetical protein [Acidithiobacillus sp.]
MWYELHTFQSKLDTLRAFLTELASREQEIVTFGLTRIARWESYHHARPILDQFEADLLEIENYSKYIDKGIHEQITKLETEARIVEELTTIAVKLDILTNKKALSIGGAVFNSLLLQIPYLPVLLKHRQLFLKEQISIDKTLVTIMRLNSLVKRLEKIASKVTSLDDEIFKPSNIDANLLLERLDNAILALETTNSIAPQDRARLIEYITSAKAEVSCDRPNWNKIVGALVIVATLLGGVATAPKAYENVAQAIQHILGVSFEKHVPNMLPPPPSTEPEIEEAGDDIAIT